MGMKSEYEEWVWRVIWRVSMKSNMNSEYEEWVRRVGKKNEYEGMSMKKWVRGKEISALLTIKNILPKKY